MNVVFRQSTNNMDLVAETPMDALCLSILSKKLGRFVETQSGVVTLTIPMMLAVGFTLMAVGLTHAAVITMFGAAIVFNADVFLGGRNK